MAEILKYIYFTSRKLVIYLHGGPRFNIYKEDEDPFVWFLLKNKVNVIVINYPFVPREGGNIDLKFIRRKILSLMEIYDEYIFYILGDSYGGYLASLLIDMPNIRQIIVVSGFISLKYQYIFSTERLWLREYMSKNAIDFFEISKGKTSISPIIFIQGSLDEAVPIAQFSIMQDNIKLKKLIGFKHREKGKKLNKVLREVLRQINK